MKEEAKGIGRWTKPPGAYLEDAPAIFSHLRFRRKLVKHCDRRTCSLIKLCTKRRFVAGREGTLKDPGHNFKASHPADFLAIYFFHMGRVVVVRGRGTSRTRRGCAKIRLARMETYSDRQHDIEAFVYCVSNCTMDEGARPTNVELSSTRTQLI